MAIGLATVSSPRSPKRSADRFISTALITALPFEARLHHLFWPMMAGLALAIGLAAAFFAIR